MVNVKGKVNFSSKMFNVQFQKISHLHGIAGMDETDEKEGEIQ